MVRPMHTAFDDRKGWEATLRGRKEQVQRAVTGKVEAEWQSEQTGCMKCGDRKRGGAKHVTGRESKGNKKGK
jgi:hypothetical protein